MDCLLRSYLVAIVLIFWIQSDEDFVIASLVCAYSKPDNDRSIRSVTTHSSQAIEDIDSIDSRNKTTESCPTEHKFCYILWQYNPNHPMNASLYTILAKGCWDTTNEIECRVEHCFSYTKPVKALNNTKFCCCSGQLCNIDISEANHLNGSHLDNYPEYLNEIAIIEKRIGNQMEGRDSTDIAALVGSIGGLMIIGFMVWSIIVCGRVVNSSAVKSNCKHKNTDSLHLLESNSSSSQSSSLLCDFENLKIIEEIGRGRYGSVWKASLNDKVVAVKKFGPQYRQYFLNEKNIYFLLFMENSESLPRFYGFQETITTDARPEYHLVLGYAPLGCLQDYLRNQTIDWLTLCKMIQTVTQGLAYLHSEVNKGDKCKPCVAHRDLSSRNILVKEDNTCMICDFQFAIRISGSEYYSCGEKFDSQTASLNDVGTLRYMAPEILEGAVNLRDCESAMKQIDVYALGLVLWETASRCSELYQGIEVPAYKQPFEHEIGLHPTFEQMQVLVTRHKARPLFPDIWKDSNPAIRSLKETIEDCWDPDAEARLTSLCVEERLLELPLMWERHKSGTLTNCVGSIYSMSNQSQNYAINNQKNAFRIRSGSNSYHNPIGTNCVTVPLDHNEKLTNELQSNRFVNRFQYTNQNKNNSNEDSFVSPSSDFEKNIISAANSYKNQPKLTLPLQPHQGRNPCLERNLMHQTSEENTTTLLEHGLKFQINGSNNESVFADIFNESNGNESNSLVNNDLLNRNSNDNSRNVSRRTGNGVPPIPYVQNAVGMNTIPKQTNVPGNGHSIVVKKTNETSNVQNNSESGFSKIINALKGWPNIKAFKQRNDIKDKALIEEREPFTRNNNNNSTGSARVIDIENSLNIRPVSNSLISRSAQSQPSNPDMSASTQPKVTQIDLINGSPLINIIHSNEKSNHKTVSNHSINQLIEHSINKQNIFIERPTNLDRIEAFGDINTNPLTDSSDSSLETDLKKASLKCEFS